MKKAQVPRANEVNKLGQRKEVNHIKGNLNNAVFEMKPPALKEEAQKDQHRNYGKVPSYINKYNKQAVQRQEDKAAAEAQALLPPGTRLMPEDERLATLLDLRAAKEETTRILEKLPVVAHSMRMEKHKKELEEKLARLDRALETFSKTKVYVAL